MNRPARFKTKYLYRSRYYQTLDCYCCYCCWRTLKATTPSACRDCSGQRRLPSTLSWTCRWERSTVVRDDSREQIQAKGHYAAARQRDTGSRAGSHWEEKKKQQQQDCTNLYRKKGDRPSEYAVNNIVAIFDVTSVCLLLRSPTQTMTWSVDGWNKCDQSTQNMFSIKKRNDNNANNNNNVVYTEQRCIDVVEGRAIVNTIRSAIDLHQKTGRQFTTCASDAENKVA